ncbi:hypothetical protein F5Y15DRAFT_303416 [Xylariaceae sp. FL0016]|nr:hypothetical protein F5Y15DRAFT_303416 [Xylariaceae sp. FL0016]
MGNPPAFPDASIGGGLKQNENLFDEIFTSKNVNLALKTVVGSGVKFVPVVGALLSGLVVALWPVPKDKGLVWKDIESKVEAVAAGLIDQNNSKQMRSVTEGLYNVMRLYLDQAPNTVEKGQYFTNTMSILAANQPLYFNDEAPWNNLAYFTSVGTLHLTVLREQHLFYSSIYGHEDPQAEKHRQDLEEAVTRYLAARNAVVKKCLDWHASRITVDWHKKDSGYWNTNELHYRNPLRGVDEYFHWSENDDFVGRKKFAARKRQFETWVGTGYLAQVEALLSPSFSWPLYHPRPRAGLAADGTSDVAEGEVTDTTVRRLMMDYPGWICDGATQQMMTDEPFYFSHEDLYRRHGPITQIVLHAGDRIDGIEVFYGGVAAPVRGRVGGGQHETLTLKPDEMITGLYAQDWGLSGSLGALKIAASRADGTWTQSIQAGRKDWISTSQWKYSFDGHGGGLLAGDYAKRLLWFSGWSQADGGSGWIFRLLPVFGHYQTWGPLK